MAKKYLIKLTPHGTFFFGGERTFGQANEANYLVKSNNLPQQTALLGLVRYQLLRESSLFDKDLNRIKSKEKGKVPNLIGATSFHVGEPFEFGKIKSISPLFIAREKEGDVSYFIETNKEYQTDPTTDETTFLEIGPLEDPNSNFLQLENYKAKYRLRSFYQCADSEELLDEGDIFVEQQQTGIRKNYKGVTEDDAYYIQFFKRFKNEGCRYSFAFILELDDSVDFSKLNQQKVVLGAEQRTFKMECSENPPLLAELLPKCRPSKNMNKIVLMSDAYIGDKDPFAKCDFSITDTVDFRFLKTSVEDTENYADLDRTNELKTKKVTKSEKFNLYKKGSVFYAQDTAPLAELFNNSAFMDLGYNQIQVIEKS